MQRFCDIDCGRYCSFEVGENNLGYRHLEEGFVMSLPPTGFIHSFNKVLLNPFYFPGSVLINRILRVITVSAFQGLTVKGRKID